LKQNDLPDARIMRGCHFIGKTLKRIRTFFPKSGRVGRTFEVPAPATWRVDTAAICTTVFC
jgi:hypothetical protein